MLRCILVSLLLLAASPAALASKCYGEHDCTACKNCNYCKHCNSGASDLCGVYYQARGETPPWELKKAAPLKPKLAKKKAA